jgi:hypothetical protein
MVQGTLHGSMQQPQLLDLLPSKVTTLKCFNFGSGKDTSVLRTYTLVKAKNNIDQLSSLLLKYVIGIRKFYNTVL